MSELDANLARTDPANAGSAFDRLEHLGAPADSPATTSGTAPSSPSTPVTAPQLTRRGRLRKWDRPKPPMDWRWWVGNVGKTLIATGLLMFGFVAYQLWGTGIETARAQNQLENEFDALLAETPPVVPNFVPEDGTSTAPAAPPSTVADASQPEPAEPAEPAVDAPELQPTEPVATLPPVPVQQQNIPELENGDALARLEIPKIGRNDIVVAGVQTSDLKRGPGHFPDTPLPGQLGNAAIAGHRTTYGAPFFNVDKLEVGDEIIATTLNGRFTYRVTGQQIVASNEYWVVATADPSRATLTLTSCHPKYTAQKRIVIFSELVATDSAPVGEPVINYGRPDEPADVDADIDADVATELPDESEANADTAADASADGTEDPLADDTVAADSGQPSNGGITGNVGDVTVVDESATLAAAEVSDEIVDAFSDGWFSDPGANGQVALWGMLVALVSLAAYAISRKLRRDWAGALIGIMPFVVALYFFFQNVNRLLPPNL